MTRIHDFSSSTDHKSDGYSIVRVFSASDAEAINLYRGQDVRLVRGVKEKEQCGIYEFAVMARINDSNLISPVKLYLLGHLAIALSAVIGLGVFDSTLIFSCGVAFGLMLTWPLVHTWLKRLRY